MVSPDARFDINTTVEFLNRDGSGGLRVKMEEINCSAGVTGNRQLELLGEAMAKIKEQFSNVKLQD